MNQFMEFNHPANTEFSKSIRYTPTIFGHKETDKLTIKYAKATNNVITTVSTRKV